MELLKDVLWTRDFLNEIGNRQTGSTRIYEDNNGCIGQATATKGLRRARHYLIALAALNEACQAGDVHMYRIDSDDNVADFFTKGLGGQKHSKFGSESLGYDLSFLYSSRKINPIQKEGETPSALLLSQNEGEQNNLSIPQLKREQSPRYCIPEWKILPKMRESPKERRERIQQRITQLQSRKEGELDVPETNQDGVTVSIEYTGGKGFKVDNNTNLEYQVDDNEESMKIHYVSLAEKYAELGNESKFNMYFKLAKFVGHRPKGS